MAVTTDQMYAVFQSIDAKMDLLVAHFGAGKRLPAFTPSAGAPAPPRIAPDSDLDGEHGNPVIRMKDPRDWTGDSMMELPFSECPPAYLDLWAERNDYFGRVAEEEGTKANNGKALSYYKYKDAARARGWAARLRNGWKPPLQEQSAGFPSDMASNSGQMVADDGIAF